MANLEAILNNLLVPDNAVIQQATQELKVIYKNPGVVPPLCQCLVTSASPQVRQYAAILLRRRLIKLWKTLNDVEKESIKEHVLTALDREMEKPVKRSVAHLVSVIASQELPAGKWNKLYQYIEQNCLNPDPNKREVAMLLLCSLLESNPEPFQPQFKNLMIIFNNTLQDQSCKEVPFLTIKCMTAIVEYVDSDTTKPFQALIPVCLQVVRLLVQQDEDQATEALELFDELCESEVAILAPHLTTLLMFLFEVGINTDLGDSLRVKALSLVTNIVQLRKKVISKPDMLQKVLQAIFTIMVSEGDGEDNEDDILESSSSPYDTAAKILDTLALHLSPQVIYPAAILIIGTWFESGNVKQRKAAILSVAVLCEGCADFIKEKGLLKSLLEYAFIGIKDQESVIRNASLFAIGQFAEHLQPDVSDYAADLIPVLLEQISMTITKVPHDKPSRSLVKAFYALDTYCENLGSKVVPYLKQVIDTSIEVFKIAQGLSVKEHVVSTFGALANAAEEAFLPYFSDVVIIIKECLALGSEAGDAGLLHGQAIDTLGVLARNVGRIQFMPLAADCLQLGKNAMQSSDPDIRGTAYGMLASLSYVLKEDMKEELDEIVVKLLETLQSDEGIQVHYDEPGNGLFNFNDFEGEEKKDDDDDDEDDLDDIAAIKGVTVENSYLEEKEDACNALAEIATNTGSAYLEHFDDTYREMAQLIDHTSVNIRKAVTTSLARVVIAWSSLWDQLKQEDKAELSLLFNTSLETLMASARTDSEKTGAIASLEALDDLLRALKGKLEIQPKCCKSVLEGIQEFLTKQSVCQCNEEESEVDEDEAELDRMLVEAGGALMPPFVKLVGSDRLMAEVEAFVENLLKSLKQSSPASERVYIVGTAAEMMFALDGNALKFSSKIDIFLKCLQDKDADVRSNAAFGIGVLAANAVSVLAVHYSTILQRLFVAIGSEKNGRCIDNIVAAVSRMIMAKSDVVPLDEVVPVILQKLPLREDEEELITLYKCLLFLLQNGNQIVIQSLKHVLKVFAHDISKLDNETQLVLKQILQLLSNQYSEELRAAFTHLTAEEIQNLSDL